MKIKYKVIDTAPATPDPLTEHIVIKFSARDVELMKAKAEKLGYGKTKQTLVSRFIRDCMRAQIQEVS